MDIRSSNSSNSIIRLIGTASVLPGIIMCTVTLGMLIADIIFPGMSSEQYIVYPVAYRICSALVAVCGIICIYLFMLNSHRNPGLPIVVLVLFTTWMLISTICNGITHESVNGVPYRYLGVADYMICLFGFMGCSALITKEKHRHIILTGYICVADLVAIVVLYHRFTDSVPAFNNKAGLSAVFYHENHYGYFLVMAVLISAGYFIYGKGVQMLTGVFSLLLNLAVLGLNQTMGCILAVGAVVIFILMIALLKERGILRRILILTVFLTISAVIAVIASKTVRDDVRQLIFDIWSITWGGNHGLAGHRRWLLWSETVSYIKEKPVLGYGCEGIYLMLKEATGVASPHNEVLTYAAFFGIPGACLYTIGIIMILIRSIRSELIGNRIAFMAACGYFISSLMGVAMFYTLPFFFIFLGMCLNSEELSYNNDKTLKEILLTERGC